MPSDHGSPEIAADAPRGAPELFFDLSDPSIAKLFDGYEFVWQVLSDLPAAAKAMVSNETVIRGSVMPGASIAPTDVYVDEGAHIEAGAYITGPCYIGPGAEVRHGAYIRGSVIMLRGAVLGHASEAKNSLFLPDSKAPHFAYVGDSILGSRVNLGAGTILSNVPITSARNPVTGRRPSITVSAGTDQYDTGLTKFGAILGDDCQTGCNSVLNPGTVLERGCLVYPNANVSRGYYESGTIVKLRQTIEYGSRKPSESWPGG